jgi:hypothetical protein
MNERDVCELLVERYGAQRARHLIGALRLLALFGEAEVRRRGWVSASGMAALRRDLDLAGIPWPSPGDEVGAMPQGER